jgi:starch synthase
MDETLKVLFLAAEATPFVKVGGLADVAGALPRALRALGIDVRLMIPRYGNIRSEDYDFRRLGHSIAVPLGPGKEQVHLLETMLGDDLHVYLIWDDKYFSAREKVYGFNDDPQRFVFFSRAAIAALRALSWMPDVIHANDWHTAMVPVWLDIYGHEDALYRDIATLFSIHSFAYQGICGRLLLKFAQMQDVPHLSVEPPGQLNWMAQGIAHADLVNTASPSYAREILTEETGGGLHVLLQEREDSLFGILNGLDTTLWDPESDNALTQTFGVNTLHMRAVNKAALQREVRLPARPDVPLLGWVARLDPIKGLDIMAAALVSILQKQDAQFIMLGAGDPDQEARFQALQERFPEYVRVLVKFDDRLARRIYGGTDLFFAPSRSEPSGVGQMIAMRYGAVPVVHMTGSLADTVVDADAQPSRGTGFTFRQYEPQAFEDAVQRALSAYRDEARWPTIQKRAMQMDFSWKTSARAYLDLYRRALAMRQAR